MSTAYHPQTDGQTERVNLIVEDMLHAYILEYKGVWDDHLPMVEFSYNNSYQASIEMAPFEALYGRRCRTPMYWAEVGEQTLIGLELLQEMEDTVRKVRDRMKRAQDRYTKYVNNRRRPLEFMVGDFDYLKVSPMLGVKRFGMQSKLSPRFVGPFEITERVGEVAYRLKLTDALTGVHDVFHVSQLRKCIRRPDQVIEAEPLMIQPDLTYEERPIRIED